MTSRLACMTATMKFVGRRSAIAMLVLSMAGCASVTDSQRTKAEAVGVVGAAGAIAGYVIGGKKGALIGGSAGVALGNALGNAVIQKKKSYIRSEEDLNSMIAAIDRSTTELRTMNTQLASDILALQRRREALQAKQATLQERQNELQYQQQTLAQLAAKTTHAIGATEAQLAEQRQLLADARAANTPHIKLVSLAEIQSDKLAQEREVLVASLQQLQSIDPRRLY